MKPSVLTAPGKCLWSSVLSFLSEQVQLATPVPLNSPGRCREKGKGSAETTHCVLLNLSVYLFPHLWNGSNNSACFRRVSLTIKRVCTERASGAVPDTSRTCAERRHWCCLRWDALSVSLQDELNSALDGSLLCSRLSLPLPQCVFKPLWEKLSSFSPAPSPVNLGSPVLCLCRILHLPSCWIGLFYCYCLLSWVSPFWFTSCMKAEAISLLVITVFTIPGTSLVQSMRFINICRWIKLKFNEA